jgi:hypothetical protein
MIYISYDVIICPIFKKVINLTAITIEAYIIGYSIYILNGRLKKITENLLGEYQCGFRKNGSTSDQIFIIRQMIEKTLST